MNLNEIAEKAYNTAIKRGQYQGDIKDVLLHLVTEVGELIKSNKMANYGLFEQLVEKMGYKEAYEFAIKDTIDAEIGGIVLLIAGLSKCYNIDLEIAVSMEQKYNEQRI